MRRERQCLLAAAMAVILTTSGCASSAQTVAPEPQPRPGAADPAPTTVEPQPASFAEWRDRFRARALAAGISAATFERAFAGVTPNPVVLERDAYQPEFTRPIWEYLDSAVSETRIATGRREAQSRRSLLESIEQRHGVDY